MNNILGVLALCAVLFGFLTNCPAGTTKLPAIVLEYNTNSDSNISQEASVAAAWLRQGEVPVYAFKNLHGTQLENTVRSVGLSAPTLTLIFSHGGSNANGVHYLAGTYRTREDVINPLRRGLGDTLGRVTPIWISACYSGAGISSPLEATAASAQEDQQCSMSFLFNAQGQTVGVYDRFLWPIIAAYRDIDLFDQWDKNKDGILSPRELSEYFMASFQRTASDDKTHRFTLSGLPCDHEPSSNYTECGLNIFTMLGKIAEVKLKYGPKNVSAKRGFRYHVNYVYPQQVQYSNGVIGVVNYTASVIFTNELPGLSCEQLLVGSTIVSCSIVTQAAYWDLAVTEKGLTGFSNNNGSQSWFNEDTLNGFFLPRAVAPDMAKLKETPFFRSLVVQITARTARSFGGVAHFLADINRRKHRIIH